MSDVLTCFAMVNEIYLSLNFFNEIVHVLSDDFIIQCLLLVRVREEGILLNLLLFFFALKKHTTKYNRNYINIHLYFLSLSQHMFGFIGRGIGQRSAG